MRYELFISLRYLVAKHRERFISAISLISILGIAVGVMALIVVIAVMSGFDVNLRDKIVGTNAHVLIEKEKVNVIISAHGNSMRPFRRHFEDLTIDQMMKLENPHDKYFDYIVEFR